MHVTSAFAVAALAAPVLGDVHYLYSGYFAGSTIAGMEFDDSDSSLTLVENITINTADGSKWVTLDSLHKNFYVATTGSFQSYSILANQSLAYQSSVDLSDSCNNANFIVATTSSPYTVFGAPYSTNCSALAISVDSAGTLETAFANVTYNITGGVHGLALSPDNAFVYSGDDMGNAVWAHSYDSSTGVVEEIQYLAAPTGMDPRHLAVHPNGDWLYVIYEAGNSVAVYSRDPDTGLLTDMNTTYSLLPSSYTNTSSYWADEALFSIPQDDSSKTAPKYLIAATRSRTTGAPGYVSAFALDPVTGAITEQLFLLPTTSTGGSANAVSPSLFSEDYFAITDSGANFVEVWQIAGSDNATTAVPVAHLDLEEGPANVVWYS